MQLNNQSPPKDNQEAFDRACERLLGLIDVPRCYDMDANRCVYRKMDGDKIVNCCVVGYMLPDFPCLRPASELHTANVLGLKLRSPAVAEWLGQVSMQMLTSLQSVHDNTESWLSREAMESRLRDVAVHYGLKFQWKDKEDVT